MMGNNSWLAPVLGLAGTVVVAALGYYQWRRTDKQRRDREFNQKRAATLQTLVERMQGLQLVSRNRTVQRAGLEAQKKQLNEFLIENRLWLKPKDEELARSYLDALIAINTAMDSAPNEDLDVFYATMDRPYSDNVAGEFRKLGEAEKALVDTAREAMRKL